MHMCVGQQQTAVAVAQTATARLGAATDVGDACDVHVTCM
jgi:hypothetical protein